MRPRQLLKCYNCGTNGHGVRECPGISCHYCHDRGHIVDNCPKKRHRSPTGSDGGSDNGRIPFLYNTQGATHGYSDSERCFTCKEYGHRSEACAQTVCHDCGRRGHIAKMCPQKREAILEKKCYFCKRKGHQIAECDLKRQYPNEEKLCYMCLKPGHHANECHNAAVCHLCTKPGHISNDCPTRECSNCHEHGHGVAKCPSVRCFRCNENGHMANECDDETIGAVPSDGAANRQVSAVGSSSHHNPTQSPAFVPVQNPLPQMPPIEEGAKGGQPNGRVCVLIDGSYFEASVRQADPMAPDFARVRLALQHTLQFIGAVFGKTPYGFWFDMDPASMTEFVEQEFLPPQRDLALRRLQAKNADLISHMCSGRGLSNVVTRLLGKIRHRPIVNNLGFGGSWMPAGVDVAIATSIIECFESKQFSQVVLLSGDGALCPAVDFCNSKRQTMSEGSAKAPVRVCGCMSTMDALFGSKQELVDFLPRIFLDSSEHHEEGNNITFPISSSFQ